MSFFKDLFAWLLTERGHDLGLLILRVAAGAFLMTHGWAKIQNFTELSQSFPDPVGWGAKGSLMLIIFAEFFCSILVILGLFTKLAVIPIIIGMMVAAFWAERPFAFGKSEMALLYLVVFFSFFFLGAGRYSFDHLIGKWIST